MRSTSFWPIFRAGVQVAGVGVAVVASRRIRVVAGQAWWLKKYTGTWW